MVGLATFLFEPRHFFFIEVRVLSQWSEKSCIFCFPFHDFSIEFRHFLLFILFSKGKNYTISNECWCFSRSHQYFYFKVAKLYYCYISLIILFIFLLKKNSTIIFKKNNYKVTRTNVHRFVFVLFCFVLLVFVFVCLFVCLVCSFLSCVLSFLHIWTNKICMN